MRGANFDLLLASAAARNPARTASLALPSAFEESGNTSAICFGALARSSAADGAGATVVLADGEGVASVGAAAAAGAAGAAGTAAGADAGVAAGVERARGGVLVLGFSCDTAGAR